MGVCALGDPGSSPVPMSVAAAVTGNMTTRAGDMEVGTGKEAINFGETPRVRVRLKM